ncbi:MAG: ImmA/IrrE family metallo-endopeptidase [Gammaproteobacteria bacterium]|nr:ImmA/IrrE family metallo-endopeptidase [Gammaproteobacteria bacterium]
MIEVAGVIRKSELIVEVSPQFRPEVRRFTAAHELGHALFHTTEGLHRDRALDGATTAARDRIEYEADRFATHFLMPRDQVKKAFTQRYLAPPFVVTEESAFALGFKNASALAERCRETRDLSRLLASADSYNAVSFTPLAEHFGVSREAMAIRLEELELTTLL